ncbi:hypothetical protein [Devosia sp.]|uniref:hypothetical protein n=1 Tax=Devosia sp. TaxID=1871048 RepID=UPI00326344F3
MEKPTARYVFDAILGWGRGTVLENGTEEFPVPSGPVILNADILAGIRDDLLANAEQLLIEIESALAGADLRAADQGLRALKTAAQTLGYRGLARAAQTGRGILGMAPGLDMLALRTSLDLANAATRPDLATPAYCDLGSSPLRAMILDQEQYWTAIEMHIELQSTERPRH